MSDPKDLLVLRLEARVVSLRAADTRARATDASMHLREAMGLLEPIDRSPELDRVAELLDEAATILITRLEDDR